MDHVTAAELALAGIGASAFVGVAGIAATARVARRTSQDQRLTALAKQLWMRRADVYVELLHVLADWAADRHRARMELVTNPTTPPRTPTTRDWSLLQAKTDAFASPLVADLFSATIDADKELMASHLKWVEATDKNAEVARTGVAPPGFRGGQVAMHLYEQAKNGATQADTAAEACRTAIGRELREHTDRPLLDAGPEKRRWRRRTEGPPTLDSGDP